MTAKLLKGPVPILIVSAVLWGAPATGAHACCSHGHRSQPRDAQQPGSPQPSPGSSQVSSNSSDASNENCFRRYDERCNTARNQQRGHSDD